MVEGPVQHAELRAMGCALGQGYLFARPMPISELSSRLAADPQLAVLSPAEAPQRGLTGQTRHDVPGRQPVTRMEAARMPRLQAKSFDDPDGVRSTPNVRFETIGLDDATIGHCRFEPGWRWSTEFGEQLGLASCPIRHLGYSISGRVRVVMDDGETLDIGPNMVFDIPPGHDQWTIGDEPWVTVEWGASGRALSEALEDPGSRALATVLFTDIVDSTAHLRELGDARWRDVLATHNARLREQLNVFRGREVATTGDGLLVVFDSPTRAVRCAAAMTRAARAAGVEIRVGVHTGEVELVGDDVRGIAVHVAARILAVAGAGEVMVSSTTAELLEGSSLELKDAGSHELKGLTGARQLFRVTIPR